MLFLWQLGQAYSTAAAHFTFCPLPATSTLQHILNPAFYNGEHGVEQRYQRKWVGEATASCIPIGESNCVCSEVTGVWDRRLPTKSFKDSVCEHTKHLKHIPHTKES